MLKYLFNIGIFSMVLMSVEVDGRQESPEEKSNSKYSSALQHPLLRAHFRKLYLGVRTASEPRLRSSPFSEKVIDYQISHFISGVELNLEVLSKSVDQLVRSRKNLSRSRTEESKFAVRANIRQLASVISKRSSRLRSSLRRILGHLRSKAEVVPTVNRNSRENSYVAEIFYIERQASNAGRLIRDYFFSSKPTVNVRDLKQHNMLILLHLAQEMAKALERDISLAP
jgi:hypothetical protein